MRHLNIATAANENYAPGLLVMIASALTALNPEVSVTIHLFNGGLSSWTMKKLRETCRRLHAHCSLSNVAFDETVFAGTKLGPGNSYMTYTRLLLGSMLCVEKVIYIDSDILIFKDLDEIWQRDMDGRLVLVCQDAFVEIVSNDCPWELDEEAKRQPYFNAGLMVIDLKQWRDRKLEEASLKLGRLAVGRFWDQTILNYVLRKDFTLIPSHWNWQFQSDPDNALSSLPNYHFLAVRKPWCYYGNSLGFKLWRLYYSMYFGNPTLHLFLRKDYRRLIGWIKDVLLQKIACLRQMREFYLQLNRRSASRGESRVNGYDAQVLGQIKAMIRRRRI